MAVQMTPEEKAQMRDHLIAQLDKALDASWFDVNVTNGIVETGVDELGFVLRAFDGSHTLLIRWRE